MELFNLASITSLVFTVIEAVANLIPAKLKPPIAIALGVGWASAANYTMPGAFPNEMAAIAIGVAAGAAASGIDAYRGTYGQQAQ